MSKENRYFAVSDPWPFYSDFDPYPERPGTQYLGAALDDAMKKWKDISSRKIIMLEMAERTHLADYLQINFAAWGSRRPDPKKFWRDFLTGERGKIIRKLDHEYPGVNWTLWAFPLYAYYSTEHEANSMDYFRRAFFNVPEDFQAIHLTRDPTAIGSVYRRIFPDE